MLAELLEKHSIGTLNESITTDQIDLLKHDLQQEIDRRKNQIHQSYLSKTDDINKINLQNAKLIEQCEQLELKRKELIQQVGDYSKLENHARHINSNYHQVHHLNQFINGLKELTRLQNHIQECRQLCKKGHLSEAKTLYVTIENLINNDYLFPHTNDKFYQQHYPLYETFQRYVRQLRTEISQTHHILWNDGVDRTNKNQLKLNVNYLDQLFEATFYEAKGEKILMEKNIQTFATFCFERFIQILVDKKLKLTIDEEDKMALIVMDNNEIATDNKIEQFTEMIHNLMNFFRTLYTYLLSRTMKIQTTNDKSIELTSLMKIFSTTIVNDFIELIREHLLNVIPNDFQYVEIFRRSFETVIEFENNLLQIEFFSSKQSSNPISSVVGDIDESIVKSRCRSYLLRSRQMLHSNAAITTSSSKTIEIGDCQELFKQNEREKEKYKMETSSNILTSAISLDELDANMFRFPRTIILEYVYEYMEFVRTVLQEADQLDNHGAHLCTTARNMMELFHVIFASLHEKQIQDFPYLIALHFNTYMYVAHVCLLLGEEFYNLKSKTGDGQPIAFVDYVPIFRNQAANLLKDQLDLQRDNLTSFLKEIGDFHNIVDEDENQEMLKRTINKCIIHMESLCHNWRSVFSPYVYFKVIGYLCDHVSHYLIKETLSLEDIPERECEIMVDAFTQWSTFLQNILVKDDLSPGLNILARLAPNLSRFNELCIVLNSSLQNIVDRWFNGQGPLASQFASFEIKQLIRALFKTSERRTAALAKIQ